MIRCTKCNETWKTDNVELIASCNTGGKCIFVLDKNPPEPISFPPVSQRAKNFSKAVVRHAKNKFKKRKAEEIKEIYENHCSKCEFLVNDSCAKCGCPVSANTIYRNKLRWASEKCPLDKW